VHFPVVDLGRGANVGKECNAVRHLGAGNTAATDGKSSCYTNTLRSLQCQYIIFVFFYSF